MAEARSGTGRRLGWGDEVSTLLQVQSPGRVWVWTIMLTPFISYLSLGRHQPGPAPAAAAASTTTNHSRRIHSECSRQRRSCLARIHQPLVLRVDAAVAGGHVRHD